jgi:hypothetical protein
MNHTKENILEVLRAGAATVWFTKTNGESRELKCTLCNELMPEYIPSATAAVKPRIENPDLVRAYDLVNEDWRSFKVSSVTKLLSV